MRIPVGSATSYRGRNSRANWPVLLLFVGGALAVGAISALFSPGVSTSAAIWYGSLIKPAWVPPDRWFGPAWTTLYVLMGISGWLVWRERYHRNRNMALGAYGVQLFLNALWAPLFFGFKSVGTGLFVIVALGLSIVWMIREFATLRPIAAWMSLPYLLWVGFASALNLSLWKLNQ